MNPLTRMTVHEFCIVHCRSGIGCLVRRDLPPYNDQVAEWTFMTNHTHVLVCLSADPDLRIRDLAERVGITERATQRIVGELTTEGYLEKTRMGRRNSYRVIDTEPLRHPVEGQYTIGDLLRAMAGPDRT